MCRMLIDDVKSLRVPRDDIGEIHLADGLDAAFASERTGSLHRLTRCLRALRRFRDLLRRCLRHGIAHGLRRAQLRLRGGKALCIHFARHGRRPRRRKGRGRMSRGRPCLFCSACLSRRSSRRHEAQRLARDVRLRMLHSRRDPREAEVLRRAHGIEHSLVDSLEEQPLILELHLDLLRMDVDIHRARRHREHQHRQRKAILRHERLIGVVDGLRERAALDDAPVDDERLPGAAALEHRRLRDESFDADALRLICKGKREQRIRHMRAVDGLDRIVETAVPRRQQRHLVVIEETERDLRMRERELYDKIVDARPLRMIRLEEFLARRRIEKEILDLYRRAEARPRLADIRRLAAADLDLRAEICARLARLHAEARDGGNRRQCLAAEAQRPHGREIPRLADLARRVAQDGELGVLAAHALAVVRHAHKARAAREDLHLDLRRARVDGVLDELLDNGGRALDDLSRRDFVDGRVIEHMDDAHARPSSPFACSCRR